MIQKFKKFIELSAEEKKLFLEAYTFLGIMRLGILVVSFKRLTRSLEHVTEDKELLGLNEKDMKTARKIGKTIMKASFHTPWESACLVQALTAQKMLQKRGISGFFYLGVTKDKDGKNYMKAHAWSKCGNIIITGGAGYEEYKILSTFRW